MKALLLATLVLTSPAGAVGLGPLSKEGLTDGPRKAFWLTILNPYPQVEEFSATAIAIDGEELSPHVTIEPSVIRLGGGRDARLLVIADGIEPSQTYRFRVCAQLAHPPGGVMINARVCSKLSARRLP